jgi:hypothetical protein
MGQLPTNHKINIARNEKYTWGYFYHKWDYYALIINHTAILKYINKLRAKAKQSPIEV